MATTIKAGTVEVWIRARTEALMAGMSKAAAAVQQFGKRMQTLGTSITRTSKTFMIAGVAIGAALAVPLLTFAQFEQSMVNVQSVAGATAKEFDELSQFARRMGEQTIYSDTQAADAMYYLASAGLEVREIMETLPAVLSLAAATQYELAETSRVMVATLNQFSLATNEAERVANVFAAAISGSQAQMYKLGHSMAYAGTIAGAMGFSLEHTTAILAKLYDAGWEASMAGTAVRMALASLMEPTEKAREALEKYGVSLEDIDPTLYDLADILDAITARTRSSSEAIKLLFKVFPVRAAGAMVSLWQQGTNELRKMEKAITGTNKAAEMEQIQLNSLTNQFKLFRSALQETSLIIMGTQEESLGNALRNLLKERLTPLVQKLNAFLKINKDFAVGIGLVGAALSTSLIVFGLFGYILGKLLIGVGTLFIIFGKIAHFFLSFPGLVLVGAAALLYLTGAFSTIKDVWNMVVSRLKQIWRDSAETIIETGNKITIEARNVWQRIAYFWKHGTEAIWNIIKEKFPEFTKKISETWRKIKEITEKILKPIIEGWEKDVGPALGRLIETIKKQWDKIDKWWKETGDKTTKIMKQAWEITWNAISKVTSAVIDEISIVIDEGMNAILGFIKLVTSFLDADWAGVWQGAKEIAVAAMNLLGRTLENVIDKLTGLEGTGRSVFIAIGRFIDGVIQKIEALINTIGRLNEALQLKFLTGAQPMPAGAGYIGPRGEDVERISPWGEDPFAGTHAEGYGSKSVITVNVNGADDPDLVANRVVQKIKQLERLGQFKLAPELAR